MRKNKSKYNLTTILSIIGIVLAIAGIFLSLFLFIISPWYQQKYHPKKTTIILPEGTVIKTVQPSPEKKAIRKKSPTRAIPDNKIEIPSSPPGETRRTTLETSSGIRFEIENKAPDRFKSVY